VIGEETLLLSDSLFNRHRVLNIFLSTIFNTDPTQTERDVLAQQHSFSVGAAIHNVDFGNYTDSADTLGVKSASHQKTVRDSHIGISRNNTKNDSAAITHVSVAHGHGDLFDVVGLAGNGDFSDTRKINEGEVGAGMGVDLEHDGLVNDVGVVTANLIGKANNMLLNFFKIGEFLSGDLIRENSVGFLVEGGVVKTHFERATSTKTGSTGKEVKSNNRFEDGRLSGGLTTKHCDTGQRDILLETNIPEFILNRSIIRKDILDKAETLHIYLITW